MKVITIKKKFKSSECICTGLLGCVRCVEALVLIVTSLANGRRSWLVIEALKEGVMRF